MDSSAFLSDYLAATVRALQDLPNPPLCQALDLLLEARLAGRSVYVIGNGGSAATASHLVCDLSKTARVPGRRPLRAFALADNLPSLTAWANDTSYDQVFAGPLDGLLDPGDVVVAISASGNSPNIVAGLMVAAARGAHRIGLLGFDGGRARELVEVSIHVDSYDYGVVESVHLAVVHALTRAARRRLEQAPPGGEPWVAVATPAPLRTQERHR